MTSFFLEFLVFGLKQARACIFAGSFMLLLLLSKQLPLFGLHRYDFLCLAAIFIQVILVATRIETRDELCVLMVFHAIGFGLELFKVNVSHSWSYPEAGWLKIANVPLYSGFMYAAVASYMCQAWKQLRLQLRHYPSSWSSVPLALAAYANFFTNYYLPDIRWWLIGGVFVVFWRASVHFTVLTVQRSMPLIVSFLLIGFFVWLAENFSTYFGAWVYQNQRHGWQVVHPRILSSWFLMVIVSFILVADLKHLRQTLTAENVPTPILGSERPALQRT